VKETANGDVFDGEFVNRSLSQVSFDIRRSLFTYVVLFHRSLLTCVGLFAYVVLFLIDLV